MADASAVGEQSLPDLDSLRNGNGHKNHWGEKALQECASLGLKEDSSRVRKPDDIDAPVVFCGTANQPLGLEIGKALNISLGELLVVRFADGEKSIKINTSVRNRDVFIVQPTSPPVNENLMELFLTVSTMRRASARTITAVIPYYGYARQDRKTQARVPISAADVARLLEASGVDRVISMDLHCGQIQGFFSPRTPVDNLPGSLVAYPYFIKKGLTDPVVVSPDAGGVERATIFRNGLSKSGMETGFAMIIKQREVANQVKSMDLVGNVENKDVIIVDDMIDTATTLCKAAKELKDAGARRVFAFATHPVFSNNAMDKIQASVMDEVVVINTIFLDPVQLEAHPKIKQLNVGPVLAEAIRRISTNESISAIFG
eukprot:jgi/Chlat1/2871/Chrsp195S03013